MIEYACTDCPLHATCITVKMDGKGPIPATLMIVCEAPGATEDIEGKPLVGKSGRELDAMLRDAGLRPEDIRMTNAVRCRPPGNRDPVPAEMDACRKHLIAEIHAVKPLAIIAMGGAALHTLTKITGIKQQRGKELSLHGDFGYECGVWPTYHPAMCLYQPMTRNVIVADLRRIRDRNTEQSKIEWKLDERLPPADVFAIDIETFDESGAITDRVTQFAIAAGESVSVSREKNPVDLLPLGALWYNQQIETVTHNGWRFDVPKLRAQCVGDWPWGRDTLVLAYLLDETQPLGLEALCVKYLGVRGWKEDREGAPLGSDALAAYNARDAVYTLRLYHKLLAELDGRERIADRIILPGYLALLDCSARGIWIDGEAVEAANVEVSAIVERTHARLQEIVGSVGETKKGVPIPFNPNSIQQTVAYLEREGHMLYRTTDTGRTKLDKAVLEELIDHDSTEFLVTLREYKGATKKLSTYIKPYAAAAASDDHRMHNEYTAWNTVTGRTSARLSNVQNLDRRYKGFLSAPPGAVALEADYAAVEFRIGAWYANERTIIGHYARDPWWDPHTFFAALFYGITEDEVRAEHRLLTAAGNPNTKRQIAKSANFALQYIGVAPTLVEYAAQFGIHLPWKTAHAITETWRSTFNGFVGFWNTTWEEVKANGFAESATGRRRHFGDVTKLRGPEREAARREAVNFKIQSLATADLGLLALAECRAASLPINYFGHDAIRFEFASRADYEARVADIRPAMIDRPLDVLRTEFGCNITIPLEIEVKLYAQTRQ